MTIELQKILADHLVAVVIVLLLEWQEITMGQRFTTLAQASAVNLNAAYFP